MAYVEDIQARLFRVKPMITSECARKIPYDWSKDITRAKSALSYCPISFETRDRANDYLVTSYKAGAIIAQSIINGNDCVAHWKHI